ncbi:hypothetical protein VOI54_16380 [Tamlana sp. 2201CG12-4]|uniref:hypothetical protein n=1 Tax=Tamlana sp. 2201CG12-4 TaxID=3112582 RepID=UPI002DBC6F94|nr:hypothetical protein [Tamlana sp. 2201CG12-4]MEC3908609.1 hypothetical protein [Tamlana sp. 2201CG12-4]
MSKSNIDDIFRNLEDKFDVETPDNGHELRFLEKLNAQNNPPQKIINSKTKFWKPFLGIAASITLLISVFIVGQQEEDALDLASVSPKMAQTQDFFTTTINDELKKLQKESAPEVQALIQDALKRIKYLEDNYQNLKIDLRESGEDNRVIYAMISNFQNRIDILQNTLEQINIVKQLKNSSNIISETNI